MRKATCGILGVEGRKSYFNPLQMRLHSVESEMYPKSFAITEILHMHAKNLEHVLSFVYEWEAARRKRVHLPGKACVRFSGEHKFRLLSHRKV